MTDKLHGFSRDDLEAIADGLEAGYDKTVNVGPAIEPGFDVHLESSTAAAARFIRAALGVKGCASSPTVDDLMELARVYAHAYFNHHTGSRDGMLDKSRDALRAALTSGVALLNTEQEKTDGRA